MLQLVTCNGMLATKVVSVAEPISKSHQLNINDQNFSDRAKFAQHPPQSPAKSRVFGTVAEGRGGGQAVMWKDFRTRR